MFARANPIRAGKMNSALVRNKKAWKQLPVLIELHSVQAFSSVESVLVCALADSVSVRGSTSFLKTAAL
jgi:hypothetical protein